jgi:hypothetical protein
MREAGLNNKCPWNQPCVFEFTREAGLNNKCPFGTSPVCSSLQGKAGLTYDALLVEGYELLQSETPGTAWAAQYAVTPKALRTTLPSRQPDLCHASSSMGPQVSPECNAAARCAVTLRHSALPLPAAKQPDCSRLYQQQRGRATQRRLHSGSALYCDLPGHCAVPCHSASLLGLYQQQHGTSGQTRLQRGSALCCDLEAQCIASAIRLDHHWFQ